jgi:catechol 2,3-dioxygenase-like lactoylglutathione lyase family enzyme
MNRRELLRCLGGWALPLPTGVIGQALLHAADLPLRTSGLEHVGLTVPDAEAAARFYGRLFDPQLFQERDPPPRFYVKVGTGYFAFGGNTTAAPSIDHFCALVEDYRPAEMRKTLEAGGVALGPGPLGMATDPDGFRLQLLGVPGGLARTIVPAFRISQEDALFQAVGLEHVMLHVSDLERSAAHYRKLFGPEVSRNSKPPRVWFGAARTRLGLEQLPTQSSEKPNVHHVSVRVAGFDRRGALEKLRRAGAELVPSNEDQVVRFRDPNGLTMELRSS